MNKINIPRCLHRALHASGYIPVHPSRELMVAEINDGGYSERALSEREVQLNLGHMVIGAER